MISSLDLEVPSPASEISSSDITVNYKNLIRIDEENRQQRRIY